MTPSQALMPHLPYLRRYARALTGSQESGDAYVRACLEAVLEGGMEVLGDLPPRQGIYRLFHVVWSSATKYEAGGEEPLDSAAAVEKRLLALPPGDREALLLTAVEGFSMAEAGTILGVSAEQVGALVGSAQRALETSLATDVLIIEDEPIIALDLEMLVQELGHRVQGVAATHQEALELARKDSRPGLVLSDVRLADGSSGIDAVRDILQSFDVPVIFITAYPERLLTGERPEPTYLITKPFSHEMVKATIGQALFFHESCTAA